MRSLKNAILALTFSAVLGTEMADAQNGYRPTRYQPANPTTSPYLNLLNNGGNFATNYYSIIRPQLRQGQLNQQQGAALQRQARALQGLDETIHRDLLNPEETRTTGRAGWFRTGTERSGYQNTSHYFFRHDENKRNSFNGR